MLIILMMILIGITPVFANDLCKEMKLGWHFYCETPLAQKTQSADTTPNNIAHARAQLMEIQQKLEDLKINAIINPTETNVANYIAFQNMQMERATQFAQAWQRTLWGHPDLDYSVKTPISTAGNLMRNEINARDIRNVLQTLNTRYGLFFFYKSGCIYCHKYSPILKTFAATYNIDVMPVSLDGGYLPEWPQSVYDPKKAKIFGLDDKPVPATMLFDNQNKQIIPVGYGLLTVDELEARIYQLTSMQGTK